MKYNFLGRIFLNLVLCFFVCACAQDFKVNTQSASAIKPLSYVLVGKIMDSLKAPYIIDVYQGSKRLIFVGCEHEQDSMHPQFKKIEGSYSELKPQLAFNEGGQISENVHYVSMNDAIRGDGETGVNKYCADKTGIKLMNGDTRDSLEFAINSRKNDAKKLFVYYVMERLAIPFKYGAYGDISFESFYNKAIVKWFKNYPLAQEEKSFEKFKMYYKSFTKNNFLLVRNNTSYAQDSIDIEAFDYVNDSCEFCEIGRSSKTLRDSILVSKLKTAFRKYDRILVTFGHGHAIALEPVLRSIFK
jgi:hypothetical protein